MKALVTGGAGFISSHIVDALIEKDFEVVVIDNLSTGNVNNLNKKAIFYEKDITDFESMKAIFKTERPDFVIHEAAQASVAVSVSDPILDSEVNVGGSVNILECCRKYDIKKIISASSAAIYGNPIALPIEENHQIKPLSPYGTSKFAMELYHKAYYETYGLKYAALRYSNVYGERQDPYGEAGVIAIFTEKLIEGKQAVIFGTGTQTRDFIHVSDVVSANISALKSEFSGELNISTKKETSINSLYEMMRSSCQREKSVTYEKPRKGDIEKSVLDNKKAKKMLFWTDEMPIDEGLKKTIDYFKI